MEKGINYLMYYVTGKVVKGDGYGRKLGFPTANLDVSPEVLPRGLQEGVYAGTASFMSNMSKVPFDTYRAGIVIGPDGKIEAYLAGFSGNLYGIEISLEIKKFLREYKKFDTEEELIEQIKKDVEKL